MQWAWKSMYLTQLILPIATSKLCFDFLEYYPLLTQVSKTCLLLSKDESFETSKILITDQTTDMNNQSFWTSSNLELYM